MNCFHCRTIEHEFSLNILIPRMAAFVRSLKIGDSKAGIVLEGVEGLMAEQFLDVVHVGTGSE